MSKPTFGVWYDFRQRGLEGYDRFYGECLDEIVAAEELGYSHVWLSEHHFVEDGYLPSQLVMGGVIAGRTRTIQIGTNVLLLPLYHPLRVAEDAAVLDLASGGRLILGVGAGYVDFEFEALGVNRKYRPSLVEEGVAILRRAFDEGRTGFQGKRWQLPDLPFTPQPTRRLPIFFGANTPVARERAARLGDGFLQVSGAGLEAAAQGYDHWRTLSQAPFYLGGWSYIHEDGQQAWRDVAEGIAYQVGRYADWGTDRHLPRPAAFQPQRENYPLVGNPEEVARALSAHYQRAPFDHYFFWARLPGVSHQQALRSTELFAREVIPRLALG